MNKLKEIIKHVFKGNEANNRKQQEHESVS